MLLFVTSMRHPDNADDYSYNEKLLRQTLSSISQQTSEDYAVVVVGNQLPSFELPARVQFVETSFAPPARVNGPHADRSGFIRDKGSKIGLGLIAAQDLNPDWVMIFDADDFVHRDLAKFVESQPDGPGWVIEDGLIYSQARNGFRRQPSFHRTCGTSYIVPFDSYRVPTQLTANASQEEVVESFGEVLPNIIGAHRNAVAWHRDHGRILSRLPFVGAVYHVDTGENHSGKALAGVIRPWSATLERDFGVSSNASRVKTLASCIGPFAVAQSFSSVARRVARRIGRFLGSLGALRESS